MDALPSVWFVLEAFLIAGYVVLDGFDLGAGILHPFVARTDRERALVLRAIGPVWDGNEVWLLTAGGTLVLSFPAVYAASFSGFYLPLMIVLWLLIGRACAVELRHQLDHPAWVPFWDRIFVVSSACLAICFGAALGNVVRGVPFDDTGRFFEPLWTHFGVDGQTGVLDGYTVLVGVAALAALALHGALWIALKTEGPPAERCRKATRPLWAAVLATTVLVTAATFVVQPHVPQRLRDQPWGVVFPLLAVAGLVGVLVFSRRGRDSGAFLSSCAYLAGMLASAAFGLYPYVLPCNGDPARGMTVSNSAASATSLSTALYWWIPGMVLAIGWFAFVYRHFKGRVRLADDDAVAEHEGY